MHGPRIVVAESSMDAMTLSYGDIELAKTVLLGAEDNATITLTSP